MLDQILDLVKQYGQQSVVNNQEVPNESNNVVMAEAASTISSGLQNVLSGGGLQSILSMFTGGSSQSQQQSGVLSNPIVSMMVGHLASNLVRKMNLNPTTANGIANNIIPSVLNSMVNNTRSNDPSNNNFDLNDLIASFTGGNAAADNTQTNGFDFQGLLNQFTGNGGVNAPDLNNVINTVTQRAQQQQQQQGGGLADLIQGFFK